MALGERQMMKMLIRRDLFEGQLRDLHELMVGDASYISDYIGEGPGYNEQVTRKFVEDVLFAYDAYPVAEDWFDNASEERSENVANDPEYKPIVTEENIESMTSLDGVQRKLLSSMLYCLLRLVADSPWYVGSFVEFESACKQLLGSFSRRVPAREFLVPEIAASEFGALPRGPQDIAWRANMVNQFPMLGGADIDAYDGTDPAWFLDDLNIVYEMLSGKSIGESLSAERRSAIAESCELFAYLKDDDYLRHLGEQAAQRALELGWIDADSYERWQELRDEGGADDSVPASVPSGGPEWDDVAQFRQEQEQLEEARVRYWAKIFPQKEAWCREYLAMRDAYFQLEGTTGEQGTIEWLWLQGAIWAVLDERGIALFNEHTYNEVCGYLGLAVETARNARKRFGL